MPIAIIARASGRHVYLRLRRIRPEGNARATTRADRTRADRLGQFQRSFAQGLIAVKRAVRCVQASSPSLIAKYHMPKKTLKSRVIAVICQYYLYKLNEDWMSVVVYSYNKVDLIRFGPISWPNWMVKSLIISVDHCKNAEVKSSSD
ncbi:hypothetical protein [Novosphingobium sp. PC22D]|uniref:hypothetical protein n=1 Tax=Novosphingobium sp. PC22D TaxID=1962403 RepID=UPI001145B5DD|nr:hypothetical protein [Novosphingobium sp. PC22D]